MAERITLYATPGTCSRVTMTALEEVGLDYIVEIIRLKDNENLGKRFLAKNALGKVPTIHFGNESLSENVAIITWLHDTHPSAELLPATTSALIRAQQVAYLCFCSSTLHPIVTRIAMSHNFASIDAAGDVRMRAEELMRRFMTVVETRLSDRDYWYGDEWSIMDSYLVWIYSRVVGVGFDASAFPHLGAMVQRESLRPSSQRVTAAERDMQVQIAAEST